MKHNDVAKNVVNSFASSGLIDNVEVSVTEKQEETTTAAHNDNEVGSGIIGEEPNNQNDQPEEVIEDDDSVVLEGGSRIDLKFERASKEYNFEIECDMSSPISSWLLIENTGLDAYRLVINMRHSFLNLLSQIKALWGHL